MSTAQNIVSSDTGATSDPSSNAGSIDSFQLKETLSAIAVMPERIRPIVTQLAQEMLLEEISELEKSKSRVAGMSARVSRAMLLQSARLSVYSSVVHLSLKPWHLADDAMLSEVVDALVQSGDFAVANPILLRGSPPTVYVCATPKDDRDSYLMSVAAIINGRRVHSLVLDAELFEWGTSHEQACAKLGLRPSFVAICERQSAGRHQLVNPQSLADPRPVLIFDTGGQVLTLDEAGKVVSANQSRDRAAPPSAQSPSVQSRIEALRKTQRARNGDKRPEF